MAWKHLFGIIAGSNVEVVTVWKSNNAFVGGQGNSMSAH